MMTLSGSISFVWIVGITTSLLLIESAYGFLYDPLQSRRPPGFCSKLQLHAMKATIKIVGRKPKDWLDEACEMYRVRLQPAGWEVTTEWLKNDEGLVKSVEGDLVRNTPVVMLDPGGKTFSSEDLSDKVYQWIEEGGSRLVFVIGGGT